MQGHNRKLSALWASPLCITNYWTGKEMLDEIGTKIWILFTINDYNLCQVFIKLEDYILLLTSQVKGNFTALHIFQPRKMSATFGWI